MDVGSIAILQIGGEPRVIRCEQSTNEGVYFSPADNTDVLAGLLHESLASLGVSREQDGLYPCSVDVLQQAAFPPIVLPSDLISFSAAARLLYPDVAVKTAWARVSALVNNNQLRVYRVGINPAARYVSQAEVAALQERTAVAV